MSKAKGTFWVLLFSLLGLALYQVVSIFWEAPVQRESGGWYSMAQPDAEANMLLPQEIYFTLGGEDGSYGKISNEDEQFTNVFQNAVGLLAYVLENSEPVVEDLSALPWSQEACVMNYGFELSNDLIKAQLDLETQMPEGKWSQIWILPAHSRAEKSVVYMLDQAEGICLKAETATWEREQNHMLLELLQSQAALGNRDYFSVKKAWPELEGDYLPEEAVKETAYRIQAAVNVVLNGRVNLAQAKQYALQFFQYADTVKTKENDDYIICTDEKITVKVDNTGMVQYVETLTEEEKKTIPMKEAYQLAVGFVKADLQWENEFGIDFVFSGYEIKEGEYTFYFNYLLGGIPYRAETEGQEKQMEFPIRVTVEGSRVRRYERFVLSVSVDQSTKYVLDQTWQDVLNQTAAQGSGIIGMPQLNYYYEKNQMVLYWEINTEQGRIRYKA